MPRKTINPGEHLAEELEALDMSATELARQLDVPTNRVTAILNGQRAAYLGSLPRTDGRAVGELRAHEAGGR